MCGSTLYLLGSKLEGEKDCLLRLTSLFPRVKEGCIKTSFSFILSLCLYVFCVCAYLDLPGHSSLKLYLPLILFRDDCSVT